MWSTVDRGLGALAVGAALIGFVACVQGCSGEDSEFVSSIEREWTTTGPDGEEERVAFDGELVTWNPRTDAQVKCPYRVTSFSEKTRSINIQLTCKKRTGTEDPIAHKLQFSEDRDTFELRLEGRNIGVYRVASR